MFAAQTESNLLATRPSTLLWRQSQTTMHEPQRALRWKVVVMDFFKRGLAGPFPRSVPLKEALRWDECSPVGRPTAAKPDYTKFHKTPTAHPEDRPPRRRPTAADLRRWSSARGAPVHAHRWPARPGDGFLAFPMNAILALARRNPGRRRQAARGFGSGGWQDAGARPQPPPARGQALVTPSQRRFRPPRGRRRQQGTQKPTRREGSTRRSARPPLERPRPVRPAVGQCRFHQRQSSWWLSHFGDDASATGALRAYSPQPALATAMKANMQPQPPSASFCGDAGQQRGPSVDSMAKPQP